ncbi:MAG TPA: STAS domain-containing protein [Solirubrobacteraceae bacterium]
MPPPFTWSAETPERLAEAPFFFCLRYPAEAGSARVLMVGELDLAAASEARCALRRAQNDAMTVICDLGDVSFIDLRGLHAILDAAAHARCTGARLAISNPSPVCAGLLGVLGLEGHIEVA